MLIKFTKTTLISQALPAKGKRLTLYDTEVPKLAVRMTSSGVRTFYIVKRTGASMTWIKLGVFPEMTVEQAREQAMKVLGEFANGGNPAQARLALKAEPTLNAFFAEYGVRHGEKKRTWKDDRQRFRTYLEEPLGKRKLSEITRTMVADILCEAGKGNGKKPGKAVATISNIRALVSHMFNMAVNWGYLEQNPIQGLKVAGKKVTRARFLQAHELRPFFEAVAKEGEMKRDYILLALLTGVRRSNLNAMRWDEIDLTAGEWHIPRTKNDEPQTVTLCPEAVDILRGRVEISARDEERIAAQRKNHGKPLVPTGFVFPSRGKTGHIAEPRDAVMRVMQRAGIPFGRKTENGVTLHDLRRTLGSWQARTGASLAVIGKSLNHKSLQATAIYARLDLDPVRQSVNTATSAMLEAAGLKESADVVKLPILRHAVAPL